MIDTFTSIDFETAMNHHICSVGIVTFENGIIIDEYHQLIKPPGNTYNWHTTKVHGLTSRDTQFSPSFHEVYPNIRDRLFGNIIVAHNESFDEGC
jgi:DNA polymerase-3 subunit epsilon